MSLPLPHYAASTPCVTTEQARLIEPELRAIVQGLRDAYTRLARSTCRADRRGLKPLHAQLHVLVRVHRALVKMTNRETEASQLYYETALRQLKTALGMSLMYPSLYPADSLFSVEAWAAPVGFSGPAADAQRITLRELYAAMGAEAAARERAKAALRRSISAKKTAFLRSLSEPQRAALAELSQLGAATFTAAEVSA